jgi:hypothetical protein
MSLSEILCEQVRRRAAFRCEYCGVSETDAGGKLTVDHYKPQSRSGSDDLDNLLYCCFRCNVYKADYWPDTPEAPVLWNPRRDTANAHFLVLANGLLAPLTLTARFSIERLRLNRPQLIAFRQRNQERSQALRLLSRYREAVASLEELSQQFAALLEEYRGFLEEQRLLLRKLLERPS